MLAVVTGASSGIGRAAAERLAASGHAVLAVGRDESALNDVCRGIAGQGGRAEPFVQDVTAMAAPAEIVRRAQAVDGGLDVLINAAGIIATGSVLDTSDEGWDAMLDLNVRAPFRLLRAAAPLLTERRGS